MHTLSTYSRAAATGLVSSAGPRLVLLPQHAALQSRRQSGLTTSTSGTSQSSRGNSQRAVSLPANRDPIAYQSWAADDEPIAAPTTRVPGAPQRICIFVEPSPFTYVSGYRNRFTSMIKYLVEVGCDVLVVTTGEGFTLPGIDQSGFREQPSEYEGARVVSALSIGCPGYLEVPLSFALSPRIWREVKAFNPDLIHCTSPGIMVFAAKLYAWLLKIPNVLSYHTHVPSYLPRYGLTWLVKSFWLFLRVLHGSAHLTLTTSPAMKEELVDFKVVQEKAVQVWKKGVDSEAFHPRFRSDKMRARLTGNKPDQPVMIYAGRLSLEKNLFFLKNILERIPNLCLAFVGDGPTRAELEHAFRGTNTVFMGMMHGEDLSAAYASADIFAMPSESETLGFVVLEAMASSLPVVAVRAGGIPDIITPDQNGVTGFLYESGDVEGACALVGKLVADSALRNQVGASARQEVSKWDWRAATMHLLNVQYPIAMAAAATQYGAALGAVAADAWAKQQTGADGGMKPMAA